MFRKIVVGVDGSDPSTNAVKQAAELARLCGAELHLINVPAYETTALVTSGIGGYVPLTPLPQEEGLMEAGRQVVQQAAKAAGMSAEVYVRQGDASARVIELAEEIDADLIVTGRRGLGGLASLVLGSTTQRIIHGAHCACLSVV